MIIYCKFVISSFASDIKLRDNDRYLCSLFAQEGLRERLFALLAFGGEIARIPEEVSQPMLGMIKLAWWREALEELYAKKPGASRQHPVLLALAPLIQEGACLSDSEALFMEMIEAREVELDEEPPANREALLSYARKNAALFVLMLEAIGVKDEAAKRAARHIGTAWELVLLIRRIRSYAKRERVMLPQDLLADQNLTKHDVLHGHSLERTNPIIRDIVAEAEGELASARKLQKLLPKAVRKKALPVLLASAVTRHFIRRIKKADYAVFHHDLEQGRTRLHLSLLLCSWF